MNTIDIQESSRVRLERRLSRNNRLARRQNVKRELLEVTKIVPKIEIIETHSAELKASLEVNKVLTERIVILEELIVNLRDLSKKKSISLSPKVKEEQSRQPKKKLTGSFVKSNFRQATSKKRKGGLVPTKKRFQF